MAERRTLESFIPEVSKALKPMLDTFLSALGIRRGKEEKRRVQQLQTKGRITTGFLPEMYREVGEQYGLEETGYRAEHGKGILDRAMELFGISEEWYRQQARIESEERLADLNRQLTRQGWGFQARQNELGRQLQREGWDWQSQENILSRIFTAEQSELDRALERELNRITGGGGITIPGGGGGGGGGTPPPLIRREAPAVRKLRVERPKYPRATAKKKVAPVIRKFKAEAPVYRPKTTVKRGVTTYRGTRLGRI